MSANNDPDGELQAVFAARFVAESGRLAELEAATHSSGERRAVALLRRIHEVGLGAVLIRRPASRDLIQRLAADFVKYGAKAVLLAGSQRGGDFLTNQLRGQWAERVVLSLELDDLVVIPFGPSGAAMPGEEDHREVVMTFREIHLIEGKRPDLLLFDRSFWDGLDEGAKESALTWPQRILDPADLELVERARCGIEVKNSTWHYGTRRAQGGGPLSITVKDEELRQIETWAALRKTPVLFFQVLFDEMYCMSFLRMTEAREKGYLYVPGDYELDAQTGAGGKLYHRYHLNDFRHRCADVSFPSESRAEVRILPGGSVIPFIAFEPAQATSANEEVILREVDFGGAWP